MTDLISVIIPSYNASSTIDKCLEALFSSKDARFEVVVVDDCSDDNSVEIIKEFPCKLIRLDKHSGAGKARNIGALNSNGSILFFTDADCLVAEDTLSTVRRTMAEKGESVIVGGSYTRTPYDKSFYSRFQSIFIHYCETKNTEHPDYIATHAMAVQAEIFRDSGGFREEFFPILEDVELSHRMRRAGYGLFMNPEILVQHIFNYSFLGSMRNAIKKSTYWTTYSILNRDLLVDSGAASFELKMNVGLFVVNLLFLITFLGSRNPLYLSFSLLAFLLNGVINWKLVRAFYETRGALFALRAFHYYAMLYPIAVGTGAITGTVRYLKTLHRNYSPFRHVGSILWKRRPLQLTLFLTRRCNARCPFCFYLSKNRDQKNDSHELSINEIKKISDSMGRLLWLSFSGGEIFLRDDLVEITKVFYEKNRPAMIVLPTNGLLPEIITSRTEEILKHCKKSIVTVKLSLDGPEEVDDALRGRNGAFQKTLETYRLLGELLERYDNFELGINTVFCSRNQDQMEGFIRSVRKLDKIKTHTVSLIRGEVADTALKRVDIEKYHKTINMMEQGLKEAAASLYRFRGAKLKAAQDIMQRRLIYQTLLQKKRLIPCYAGRLALVVTETGDLYPCESFQKKIGNLRESGYDIKSLLRGHQAKGAIRSIKSNECYCTHECNFMINILFNPWLYPALLKEYRQLWRTHKKSVIRPRVKNKGSRGQGFQGSSERLKRTQEAE